jgi:hypothetical protein
MSKRINFDFFANIKHFLSLESTEYLKYVIPQIFFSFTALEIELRFEILEIIDQHI